MVCKPIFKNLLIKGAIVPAILTQKSIGQSRWRWDRIRPHRAELRYQDARADD